jgi:general secretion pathway protein F
MSSELQSVDHAPAAIAYTPHSAVPLRATRPSAERIAELPELAATDRLVLVRTPALSRADFALMLGALADVLDAGLTLSHALVVVEGAVPARVGEVVPRVREGVRARRGLANALVDAGLPMCAAATAIIHDGERGTGLAAALRRAAHLCDAGSTRDALRRALAYPKLLTTVAAMTVVMLGATMLPRSSAIVARGGRSFGPMAGAVIRAGAMARGLALPAVLVLLLVGLVWRAWTSTLEGRRRWQAFLLCVPVIGDLRRGAAGARLCTSLAALLASGMPLVAALRNAAASTRDEEIIARVMRARADVERGGSLAEALARHGVVSAAVQRLVREREESGPLALVFAEAAERERERVRRRVRGAVRWGEPVMLLGLGGMVVVLGLALVQSV